MQNDKHWSKLTQTICQPSWTANGARILLRCYMLIHHCHYHAVEPPTRKSINCLILPPHVQGPNNYAGGLCRREGAAAPLFDQLLAFAIPQKTFLSLIPTILEVSGHRFKLSFQDSKSIIDASRLQEEKPPRDVDAHPSSSSHFPSFILLSWKPGRLAVSALPTA